MSLIVETLGLRCQVLGLVSWNTIIVGVDGHPFLERFDVRDKGWICDHGWADDVLLAQTGFIPSTIFRFCASLMPPE